jgi:iron complex transport system ATP-binding protein
VLEAKNLSAGYDGKAVIRDVSLQIPNGELTAIVGANGSGKSTLLKALCGALPLQAGQRFVDGVELEALSSKALAQRVSFLNQTRETPEISVMRLVLHGRFPWFGYPRTYRKEDHRLAEDALRRVGILELRDKLLAQLSGGERQKAYLAMSLTQNAANLLLDEPTTFLDVSAQLDLMHILVSVNNENKAIAAVIHDLRLALEYADTVAVMKDGRLIFTGPPGEAAESGALEEAFGVRITRGEQYQFQMN